MKFIRAKNREITDLRSAIAIALLLVVYTACLHLVSAVREFIGPTVNQSFVEPITYALVVWLMVLLWVCYRRWHAVTITDQELNNIISGINPDVFIVVTPERKIAMSNQTIAKMFGYQPSEVLEKTTDVLYFDRRTPNAKGREIYDQLERLGFHVGFATGRRKDGETFPLEIITGNLKNRRGAVLQIRDITKLIRAEEAHREKAMLLAQLEENFKKLKETEQTRDNLLHMIVHDMKNPLQIIMGYMELLKRQLNIEEDETVERCVRETLGHSSQLVQMVNSLLDIGRLEAGEMPLELEMQDLTGLVRNAIGSVAVLADGRRVSFHPPAEALPVYADANIIQRVTLNLIGNAIKHTPEGTPVSVMVESRGEEAWVGVADSGPGIPPDQHENLFRKFGRVRHSNGKKNGASTGIGLAFCKLAVEAHRGRIGVNSEVGQGSMFWFSLPLVPAPVRRPVCRV